MPSEPVIPEEQPPAPPSPLPEETHMENEITMEPAQTEEPAQPQPEPKEESAPKEYKVMESSKDCDLCEIICATLSKDDPEEKKECKLKFRDVNDGKISSAELVAEFKKRYGENWQKAVIEEFKKRGTKGMVL